MAEDKKAALAETPEFKAAVAAALDAALPAMLAQALAAGRALDGAPAPDFAKSLALEIAKISGQGTGRTYVDPALLEQREQAKERLARRLIDLRGERERARERGEDPATCAAMPLYRVIAKTQLPMGGTAGAAVIEPLWRDGHKIVQKTEIGWPAVPNLAMRPLNAAAQAVWRDFTASIGHVEAAEADPLGAMALTQQGAVVHGNAALTLLRNDPARRGDGPIAGGAEGAVMRRGDSGNLKKVRISPALAPVLVG